MASKADEFDSCSSVVGVEITLPIIPGIMPIQNYQSFRRMTNLCKARVPSDVIEALEPIRVSASKT